MGDERKGPAPEVKYSADYFINDLIAILSMLREKARLMREIEFNDIQKLQITGALVAIGTTHQVFVNKLREWGTVA